MAEGYCHSLCSLPDCRPCAALAGCSTKLGDCLPGKPVHEAPEVGETQRCSAWPGLMGSTGLGRRHGGWQL